MTSIGFVRATVAIVILTTLLLGWRLPATAQETPADEVTTIEEGVGSDSVVEPIEETGLSAAEAQDFLQSTLDELVAERDLVGAGAVILKGDQVLAAYGAGFEDKEAGIAVDPERTRFRLGSISKTVTAAAVMQLVEAGKLDLDRDVNEYLDFDASPNMDAKITLRHLLSHTAGYSDAYKYIFLRDETYYLSTAEYVRENVPDLIFEPGTIAGYSNYGITLAGYIVEVAAEMPFEQYVAENIFEPLGMHSATMAQPVEPESLSGFPEPIGYYQNGERGPFEFVGTAPAGALTSTLTDYAKFMAMMRNRGEYQGVRLLSEESFAEISRIHDVNPYQQAAKAGYGLAWYVTDEVPGRFGLTHGGDTVLFHSLAKIYLDADYSIVMSQNTEHFPITAELSRRFDALVGFPKIPALPEVPDAAEDARVAGEYAGSRYSGHGVLKLSKLLRASTSIEALPDGGGIRIGRSEHKRVGPLTYQNRENPDWGNVTFFTDSSGKVSHTNSGMTPMPLLERPGVVMPQALITFGLLGVALIAGLVALVLTALTGSAATGPWLMAGAMSACILAGIGVLATQFLGIQSDIYSMTPARDGMFRLAQLLLVAGLIALVLFVVSYARQLSAGRLGLVSAGALGLFGLAGLSVASIMLTWNFLSLSLTY
ncbi:MAG: serine hydrolase domain-containing protein [Henriciella sp.]|nr:serine hydrolase domain-containing protein [Henriciella sp.]